MLSVMSSPTLVMPILSSNRFVRAMRALLPSRRIILALPWADDGLLGGRDAEARRQNQFLLATALTTFGGTTRLQSVTSERLRPARPQWRRPRPEIYPQAQCESQF